MSDHLETLHEDSAAYLPAPEKQPGQTASRRSVKKGLRKMSEQEVQQLRDDLQLSRNETQRLQADLQLSQAAVAEMTEELVAVRTERDLLHKQDEALHQQIEGLRQQIDLLRKERNLLRQTTDGLRSSAGATKALLQEQLATARARIEHLGSQVSELERQRMERKGSSDTVDNMLTSSAEHRAAQQ